MPGRKFDPNSPRAIRGIAWQRKFLGDIAANNDAHDVREYFRDEQGIKDDLSLCLLEHRFGDVMVFSGEKVRKHFECVVCPPTGNGYFPQHKIDTYNNENGCDKWYAFIISENGKDGEEIYIQSKTWNAYASQLPKNKWQGKNFRVYSAKILRSMRKKFTCSDAVLNAG